MAKALGGVGERLFETRESEQRCGNSASVRRTRALRCSRARHVHVVLCCGRCGLLETYPYNVDIYATQLDAVSPLRASAPVSEGLMRRWIEHGRLAALLLWRQGGARKEAECARACLLDLL
jgi:hypothetical protein